MEHGIAIAIGTPEAPEVPGGLGPVRHMHMYMCMLCEVFVT